MQCTRISWGLLAVVVALAGCAAERTQQQAPSPSGPMQDDRQAQGGADRSDNAGAQNQGETGAINITPYLTLDRYVYFDKKTCASGDRPPQPGERKCFFVDDRFVDTYTRLEIHGFDDSGRPLNTTAQDIYPYESRSWASRLIAGMRKSFTLSVKVNIGDFKATVPLVSIDHTSDTNVGEQFQRVVFHRVGDFPLFLVRRDGSNGIVSASFTVQASDDYRTHMVSDLIKTAQAVAGQLAPPVPVLTTLTSAEGQKLSASMDTTLGHLFSSSIEETQRTDDDIRGWGDRVQVTLHIPPTDQDWTDIPSKPIGSWKVTFANPRPSIFSDIELCSYDLVYDQSGHPIRRPRTGNPRCYPTYDEAAKKVVAEVKADEVLSYHLAGMTSGIDTIGKYLAQQDWYPKALTAMMGQGGKGGNAGAVQSFCRTIRNTVAGLGLSSLDAGIVVTAVRDGMDVGPAVINAMKGDKSDCGT